MSSEIDPELRKSALWLAEGGPADDSGPCVFSLLSENGF